MLPEDDALDAATNNPGQQRFEKLTAGLYLGDIARRIILRSVTCGLGLLGSWLPYMPGGNPCAGLGLLSTHEFA